MPLVAVAVSPLAAEPICAGIAEGEGVALVVVIRLVGRERVVDLEPMICARTARDPDRDAAILAAGAALHRGERADAVPARETRAPRAAEHCVIPVHEAREPVGVGEGHRDRTGEPRFAERALVRSGGAHGARIPEVLVDDEDVREERDTRRRRQELVDVGRTAEEGECRVAEHRLADRTVVVAHGGEVERGDTSVIDARAQTHDFRAIPVAIPRHAEARLDHGHVRRDLAVRREVVRARPVRDRRPDEWRKEHGRRRRDHVRLLLTFQAHAVVQRQIRRRLPGILDEDAEIHLLEGLRAGLLDREPAHSGLLQVQEHRSRDALSTRACPGEARPRRAGALDIPVAVGRVVDEALHAAEDESAVREPDERLCRVHEVEFDAGLIEVIPSHHADVIEQLEPGVVVLDRDEEGTADAERVAEVHRDIGEVAAARKRRCVVVARPILTGDLEAELVRHGVRELAVERSAECVARALLDRIRTAAPGVHIEGAVGLLVVRVVVLEREEVPVTQAPVDLGEEDAGIVRPRDRTEVVGQCAAKRG